MADINTIPVGVALAQLPEEAPERDAWFAPDRDDVSPACGELRRDLRAAP